MVKMTLFKLEILHDKSPVFIALMTLLIFVPCAKSSGEEAKDAFYTVQIASYKNLSDAKAMIDSLTVQNLALFCKSVNFAKKGKWYRVLTGRYKSKQEAMDAGESLKKRGIIKSFVLRKVKSPLVDPKDMEISTPQKVNLLDVKKDIPPKKVLTMHRAAPHRLDRDKKAPLYDAAMKDFKSGSYKDALNKLEQIIQCKDFKTVKKESVSRLIGNCYYFLGKRTLNRKYFLKAIDQYRELIRDYPNSEKGDSAITTYRLAKSYEYLNLYPEGLAEFKYFYLNYPESEYIPESLFMIGKIYYQMGKFNKAIEKFKEYIKRFPDDKHIKDAYFDIGDGYFQMRQFNDADIWYGNASKRWPVLRKISKDNIFNLGSFYLQSGRYDKALRTFFAFVTLFPEEKYSKDVIYSIARSLIGAHQPSLGVKMLALVISRYPRSKEAQESSLIMADTGVTNSKIKVPIYILSGMDCYQKMIKTYDDIITQVSDNEKREELLFLKGYALLEKGDYKQSFNTYHCLLSRFFYERYREASEKNMMLSVSYLVNNYYSNEDYIPICDLYFKSYDYGLFKYGNFGTLLRIGNSLKKVGLANYAINHFRKMINKFKEDEKRNELLFNIAEIDYNRGHYDNAEKELKSLLNKQSATDKKILINARELLGNIYYRKGLFKKAASFYSEVLGVSKNIEDIADVYRDYADSLLQMNLYPSASINYKRALKICNDKHQKCSIPVITDSYEGLGDCLYSEANYKAAISMYKDSFNHIPEGKQRPWAIFNIGRSYMNLGNNTMAEKTFSILKEEGGDEFWPNLVDCYMYDKKWREKYRKYLLKLDAETGK